MRAIEAIVFLFIITISLLGCGEYQGQTSDLQKISFEQIEQSKKDGNCDDENSNNCAEIKIEYPVCTITDNKEIEKKINDYIKNEMIVSIFSDDKINTFDEMADSFFNEYRQFKAEVPDSYQEWYIERIANVIFYNDDFISLRFSEYFYLGGAHPNNYTLLTVLDLKNGDQVSLEDIFIEGYEPILNKIAEKEFRKLKEIGENERLDEAGFWFDDNNFNITDNFAISDDGLSFYYNNYEITAYAYGPTELIIPLAKISQLIKRDGILAEFMKQ